MGLSEFFLIIGIYLLYKFISGFVMPLYRATSSIKRDFRTMQEKMQEQMNQQNSNNTAPSKESQSQQQAPRHDYIEFEEVKK